MPARLGLVPPLLGAAAAQRASPVTAPRAHLPRPSCPSHRWTPSARRQGPGLLSGSLSRAWTQRLAHRAETEASARVC